MDYASLLTPDQKRELLTQRLQQLAAEAYQHNLNLKVAELTGDLAAIAFAKKHLEDLDKGIQVYSDELALLEPKAE